MLRLRRTDVEVSFACAMCNVCFVANFNLTEAWPAHGTALSQGTGLEA